MSRKIKKVISVLVIATLFVMSFAGISLSYVSAAADVTAPIVDVSTLRVSQKTATAGDTVKVSVKVTDETEINSVQIVYRRPKTYNDSRDRKSTRLNSSHNNQSRMPSSA